MYDALNEIITDINWPAKDHPDRIPIEYLHYKFEYMRAKALAKMRYFTKADKLCQYLIDTVRDLMNSSLTPTPAPSTPAAAAIPTPQAENTETTPPASASTAEEP